MEEIKVKSKGTWAAEIFWLATMCNGDDAFPATNEYRFRSTRSNVSKILLKANELGYQNVLCPLSYQSGWYTLTFTFPVYFRIFDVAGFRDQ